MLLYPNEVFCNLLLSGLKMLWEAWRMKPNEGEETQREVEEELARLGRPPTFCIYLRFEQFRRGSSPSLNTSEPPEQEGLNSQEAENIKTDTVETDLSPPNRKHFNFREKSWFGKKCVKIFRVFTNTFAMTFLAEWGDRLEFLIAYSLWSLLWKLKTWTLTYTVVIKNIPPSTLNTITIYVL